MPKKCRKCRTKYSWLSLSQTRLSRITAYLEAVIWSLPKHENLSTCKKYCGKEEKLLLRSNFSSFPQYVQYISNFKSPITHIYLLNVVNRISFYSGLQIWYVEVRISRSISESPLEFEITRVDCSIFSWPLLCRFLMALLNLNPFSPAEKTDTCANSVDPDEMAHNEPSHLDLHCLPFCLDYLTDIPICSNGACPNSVMEKSIS